MEKKKYKTVTSTAVKERYNNKTYDKILVRFRKDSGLLEAIDAECSKLGMFRNAFITEAIQDRLPKK